jgi:hypothetical protein
MRVLTLVVVGQLTPPAEPPPPAPMPPSIAVRIDFDAPPRCSGAAAFYAGLAARTAHVRRAASGESAARVKVRLIRAGAKIHGELRILHDQIDSDTRKVDGASCEQVVEALALTAALALDPSVRVASSAPAGGPAPALAAGSATAPSAGSPGGTTAAATPPPSRSAPSPSPSPSQSPSPSPSPSPPPAVTAENPPSSRAPAAAAAPAVAPPELPGGPIVQEGLAPRATERWAMGLGARTVATNAASPSVELGGGLFLRILIPRAEGTAASVALAALYGANDLLRDADVRVRWTAVVITGCPGWALHFTVLLEACAQVGGGWLSAEDRGITNPAPAAGRWSWSAGLAGRASMPLSARLVIDVEMGLGVPLVRRQFVTTTPERVAAETPKISALFGIGVAYIP